jgi:hypothetical protein
MSIKYVDEWPKQVRGTWNPTPEQCRAAGYELLANRPAEEIAAEQAQQAAQAQAVTDHMAAQAAKVQGLRDDYAATTAQVCQLCSIDPVVRCLTRQQAAQAILAASEEAKPTLALLSTLLTNLEGKLCREDGDDALDRI